ncbi:glutathione peroxidase [Phanerochaete sordida]|uniref:Glutathione peroxidase n=1 Tax=Phanerochaete sordida TaxID=48140 RepID=A0A9P3LB03_9APHY|nr:glutathione peroxidase [Phanerochaete sordida]
MRPNRLLALLSSLHLARHAARAHSALIYKHPSSLAALTSRRAHTATTLSAALYSTVAMSEFYNLKAQLPNGEPYAFDQLKGKVVLIVNTASKCGFTPQYKGLETLYQKYKDQGLVILGFPCNQFGGQEPGTDSEVASFCEKNYGVTFPLMAKSDVNGDDANEVFKYLKNQKSGLLGLTRIKWNFEKFLVDKEGNVVNRWASTTSPDAIDAEIAKLL